MDGALVVTHESAGANDAIQLYLRAFCSDASLLVVSPNRIPDVRAQPALAGWHVTDCAAHFARVDAGPDTDGARTDDLIFESSGTTGDPKLVRYRKDVIRGCATAITHALDLDPARTYTSMVNPRFAFGLSVLHSHRLASVPVHFASVPTSLDAWARFRETLRPDGAVYLAPHQSLLLAQDPSWRFDAPIELIFAGGALRQSMVEPLRACLPRATITNMYGQAELGPRISIGRSPIEDFEEGNVGRPLPGVRLRTTPTDDAGAAPGAISVHSPYRMQGYVTVAGTPCDSGAPPAWWPTGDVGTITADGELLIAGRAAADVNFLGTRVDLEALRKTVRGVEGVLDVRVSALPHPAFGQCPLVRVLIPTPDAAGGVERSVRNALSHSIGRAAAAVEVRLIDPTSLPDSGKL